MMTGRKYTGGRLQVRTATPHTLNTSKMHSKTFYETKTETLFEFNFQLMKKILELLQIPFVPEFTSSYEATYPAEVKDLRNSFTPSERNVGFPKYNQVFGNRYGFISDLSIVDLLFNKGMEAKKYLSEI